jgi:hypothetical protein
MKSGLTLKELAAEIERRSTAKKDLLVSTKHIEMTLSGDHPTLVVADREQFKINGIAHGQIAEQAEIPKRYYDRMLEDAPDLLATNVNRWFQKYPVKRLLRTLDGTGRALLSDRYRPLENEDLADACLPRLLQLGLDVMSSQITDTRLYIKAVDPKVTRELTAKSAKWGEGHVGVRCLAPAVTISNSEVGLGALSVLGGVYDQWCSNLATYGERSMRKYHVGAKHELGDDVYALLSDATRQITDKATWAQIGDVVAGAFDRARFDSLCDKIANTQDDKIEGDPIEVVKLTTSRFGLSEKTGTSILRHLIDGGDLSRFGLYNAITRTASDMDDYDTATAMERNGAQIIELPKAEWQALAEAA